MLTVRNISYRYTTKNGTPTPALSDVTFALARGEITALVGPNGSGKSTLFNLLSGTLPVQQGNVSFDGAPAARLRMGVVFQSPSLDPYLTVAENIRHHAMLYGMDVRTPDLENDLLGELELEQHLDTRVSELSGGYQRRVELAKALLIEPEILVLDEPFTGLDVHAREAFFHALKHVTEQRALVTLLITHVLSVATECDRVVVLEQGRVIAHDVPAALLDEFGNTVVEMHGAPSREIAERLHTLADIRYVTLQEETVLLLDAQPQQILSHLDADEVTALLIQARRPTLDDYFVIRTGHHLVDDAEEVIAV